MNVLKIVFGMILVVMLTVTIFAQSQCNIFEIPPVVTSHPWFTATLADAYCGFVTFYCWVYYKESNAVSRTVWFVLVMLLGNIAMSIYVLKQLWSMPPGGGMRDLLLRSDA
jgi:hypothetical protein